MEYETVIGLEVHVQLQTQSKMFCACRADYQTAPVNSRVCPVCLGLPGTLPVINSKAVEYTIMTGLALGCRIPEGSKFDRKNYPYPDLMKGYQISQYDLPLAVEGHLEIEVEDQLRHIAIERVHLEEDVAKLQHFPSATGDSYSLVDVNRSGVPLMEVVSCPDLRSPEEARSYLMALHSILQYLGVSTANMQDGSFRCDANISIRPVGATEYSTRTEVKNMNSFRSVYLALQYEAERQRRVVEEGGRVTQETRGWIEERNVTVSQRSKEYAHDYRYFPEPDLPPLAVDEAWVEEIRARLPELARQRRARLVERFGIPEYDARLLTGSKATADYFEAALGQKQLSRAALEKFAKSVSNWILGDLRRLINLKNKGLAKAVSNLDRDSRDVASLLTNLENIDITGVKVTSKHLADLVGLVDAGSISVTMAKTVLEEAFTTGDAPAQIVEAKGYTQINDSSAVQTAVADAIAANPKAVTDYLGGKDTATRFLVGQVMKITRGQANPELVNQLVRKGLEALKTDTSPSPGDAGETLSATSSQSEENLEFTPR
ncbi:MAG: Asp-tRNA(Asn)/Glu-tRNA(Gln) amidotransferase subunit GatB [Dehalococcoidia bacterium]|jgi:aspartyl-tRNA(Asn)/glutamyl-tRNA(Gln) amidotransferase subunit B|nr:Asp-tRNA(Asn)/Glu-tRNA(Gln) amidotransferase subunit GatB [Dehalococcoidia bacterium]